MYSNIVATGAFAWAPSSGVPAGSGVDPDTSNADIADDGLKEGSGDSEEDVIPDFQTDMARMKEENIWNWCSAADKMPWIRDQYMNGIYTSLNISGDERGGLVMRISWQDMVMVTMKENVIAEEEM
ncbi:hypothetical protein POTOM_028892 [Populus tomentosa]|uniref:Uncharacterized protein n=1 Tax=Populus tomentosa TaxID=118781 RepID=A0A8X7ZR00_POPTO|nr:hypothetical protein POTOM_028892 [Populus tomentosa]